MADRFLNIKKSYMLLFMTNNSATSVYGKMIVCKPRKGINSTNMWPSVMASADINGAQTTAPGPNLAANDWVNPVTYTSILGVAEYQDFLGMTDLVGPTNLTDIGWLWHNSPAFQRYYKRPKVREITWAPMECKKLTFKFKKRINIDTSSEYTFRPATSELPDNVTTFQFGGALDWTATPALTGFDEMHAKRGFFVSFIMHGIPARATENGPIGLTQPNMDLYWINAYKYGWSSPGRREFHVSTPNPLGSGVPVVAIPGFGTAPGNPQLGG
jgi:hypothetical protein